MIAGIFVIALIVRLVGIRFGLPNIYTADGENRVVTAVGIIVSGDLNPHWFGHPGSTVIYLFSLNYAVVYWIGRLIGTFSSPTDINLLFQNDPTLFYLIGRAWSAIIGAGSVILVYKLGQKIWNQNAGLLAALFLAFAPLHQHWSQIARTDIPATFFVLLAVLFCLRLLDRGDWQSYGLAGLFMGLAVATKFNMAVVVFAMLTAHFLRPQRQWSLLIWGAVSAMLGFFVAAPFVILDWGNALPQMLHENRSVHPGAERLSGLANFWWYLRNPLFYGLSVPVALLAAWGGIQSLVNIVHDIRKNSFHTLSRRTRQVLILLSFPVLFFILIGTANLRWSHWVVPLLPFGTLFAAVTLSSILDHLPTKKGRRLATIVVILVLLLTPAALEIIRTDYQKTQPDTRTLAQEWFAANTPEGVKVGAEWYTGMWWSKTIDLVEEPSVALKPLSYFQDQGAKYLVTSSNVYDRFFAEPDKYPEYVAAYENIFSTLPLVHEFTPDPWRRPGPLIRIYALE
jgi:4-amino-4-deoxy-L-arabinose transferase-like glycosyltransferase